MRCINLQTCEDILRSIGFAILLGMGGTIVGALWTFAVGIGGAPGAMLTAWYMGARKSESTPIWGLIFTVTGQLYVSLAFIACVVLTARNHLDTEVGFGKWIAWFVAFFVATVPAMAALKDSAQKSEPNVQHDASAFSSALSTIGFFVFVFRPSTVPALWGWVPTF